MAAEHRTGFDPMGTTAIVTGASSGFGTLFARELAARGADLVLVARREDRLLALADELAAASGTRSTVVPLDLTAPDAATELRARLVSDGVRPATLINNAGFGTFGELATADPDRVADELAVDVVALTTLTREFLPDLLEAAQDRPGSAALVNVASTAAFQPIPRMAVYSASKSYVLHFTEAIAVEAASVGLKVTALCPGPAHTEFLGIADNGPAMIGTWSTAEAVVDRAFRALDRRRTPAVTVVGRWNAVLAKAATIGPRALIAASVGRMTSR